eukprot:gene22857-25886_t
MSKTRRWEKPAPAGTAAQNQSPLGAVTSFVDSLNESERASHRAAYLHLMQALTGSHVSVDSVDGAKLSGVLHTITPFHSKHVVVIKASKVEGDDSAAAGANDGMTIMKDFSTVVSLQNTGKLDLVSRTYSTEFATDSSIKKHGDMSHLSGRNLKSVDKSWLEASGDMSLEGKSSSGKSWDQFEANRRLFNVKDTYDENLYTKRLDLKSMTAEQIANADRLAREIEGTASANIHLQEERGQATEGDWDEEDRFSGVLRANEGTAARKAAAPVVDNNPWKRNTKLNLSGTASPVTPVTPSKQPLAPPPGVPAPGAAGAAAGKKAAPAEVAPVMAKDKTEKPVADKPVAEKKPEGEPVVEAASTAHAADPVAPAATSTSTTAEPAAPEAKPAPVKKLNAAAAEFKPSWLTASAPATPAAAPSTPMAMPQPFVPQQQFIPNNIPYNAPSTPDMYNKQPPMHNHNSPNFVPPQMHMMQQESPYGAFDPNAGYMPPQQFIPNQPMGYEGQYFMPPPQPGMIIPPQMASMDYMPNNQMMMPMMMPFGQQVPMPGHEMFGMPPPQMPFQQGNGNMFPQAPQQQMHMYGSPQQQPQGGYNNMGSGQKLKYDNNNMRNNNMNKGGRGMSGRGYNNNNNTGGRGYNSPQHHGM